MKPWITIVPMFPGGVDYIVVVYDHRPLHPAEFFDPHYYTIHTILEYKQYIGQTK